MNKSILPFSLLLKNYSIVNKQYVCTISVLETEGSKQKGQNKHFTSFLTGFLPFENVLH